MGNTNLELTGLDDRSTPPHPGGRAKERHQVEEAGAAVVPFGDRIAEMVRQHPRPGSVADSRPMISFEKENSGADDPWKPMKNVLTDITTNVFLNSEVMFHFLKIIFETFETTIEAYCQDKPFGAESIRFVYKGGNVLRFIAQRTLSRMPGDISTSLESKYSKFFKKSDADFSIYIDPDIGAGNDAVYEKVFQEVTVLAAYTLDYIRTFFANDETGEFLTLSRNTSAYTRSEMRRYLASLNEEAAKIGFTVRDLRLGDISTETANAEGSASYRGSAAPPGNPGDYYITEDERETPRQRRERRRKGRPPTMVRIRNLPLMYGNNNSEGDPLPFYITINDTLEWDKPEVEVEAAGSAQTAAAGRPPPRVTKFNLVRMKINFVAVMSDNTSHGDEAQGLERKRLAGELIDVSIPHRKDLDVIQTFQRHREHGDVFQKYVAVDASGEHNLSFESYSVAFMIHDLTRMLFHDRVYPWHDVKYEKRLKRLFFMYLVDILSPSNEKGQAHTPLKASSVMAILNEFEVCLRNARGHHRAKSLRVRAAGSRGGACSLPSLPRGAKIEMADFVRHLYPAMLGRLSGNAGAATGGDSGQLALFDKVMFEQVATMKSVVEQIIQVSTQQSVVLSGEGGANEAIPVTLAGGDRDRDRDRERSHPARTLRRAIRGMLRDRRHLKTLHSQVAEQMNRDPRHPAMLLARLHDRSAAARHAAAPQGHTPVLWINPFRSPAAYWTTERTPEHVQPSRTAHIFRVVCASTRHHLLLVEGVRDLSDRGATTHCFATKHPLGAVPPPR